MPAKTKQKKNVICMTFCNKSFVNKKKQTRAIPAIFIAVEHKTAMPAVSVRGIMALHAPSIHRARSSASVSQMMNSNIDNSARPNDQRHIVDILVGVIAVPVLILFALQLEKNIQSMATNPWLVFGLGFGLLTVIMIIIGYVTHRLSVCCWTGPIDEMGNRIDGRNMPHINSQNDVLRIVDSLPPSYDTVVKFEIPPPPYDCVIIDTDQCKAQQQAAAGVIAGKELPTSATSLHI